MQLAYRRLLLFTRSDIVSLSAAIMTSAAAVVETTCILDVGSATARFRLLGELVLAELLTLRSEVKSTFGCHSCQRAFIYSNEMCTECAQPAYGPHIVVNFVVSCSYSFGVMFVFELEPDMP